MSDNFENNIIDDKTKKDMYQLYFYRMKSKQEIVDFYGGKYTYRQVSQVLKDRIREFNVRTH